MRLLATLSSLGVLIGLAAACTSASSDQIGSNGVGELTDGTDGGLTDGALTDSELMDGAATDSGPTACPLQGAYTFDKVVPPFYDGVTGKSRSGAEFVSKAIFSCSKYVLYAVHYGAGVTTRLTGSYTLKDGHVLLTPESTALVPGSGGPVVNLLTDYIYEVSSTSLELTDVGGDGQVTTLSRAPTYCGHVDDCGIQTFPHQSCPGEARCVEKVCAWSCTASCTSSSGCASGQSCVDGSCKASCPQITKPDLACGPANLTQRIIVQADMSVPYVAGAESSLTGCNKIAWDALAATAPGVTLSPLFADLPADMLTPDMHYFLVDGTTANNHCDVAKAVKQLPFAILTYFKLPLAPP